MRASSPVTLSVSLAARSASAWSFEYSAKGSTAIVTIGVALPTDVTSPVRHDGEGQRKHDQECGAERDEPGCHRVVTRRAIDGRAALPQFRHRHEPAVRRPGRSAPRRISMTIGSWPAVARVVLVELGPQPPRLDPDDGIEPRVVLLVASEHGDANHVLLDLIALSRQRAFDDVAEEPAHPIGVGEAIAREEAIELEANLVG